MDERDFLGTGEHKPEGLLGFISSNTTDAGGALTEDEFFAAMRGAMKYRPSRPVAMVSMERVRQVQAQTRDQRQRAKSASLTYRITRRWRWLKRHRALRDFHEATTLADALQGTFGHLFEPES